jgi:hypothetical protein
MNIYNVDNCNIAAFAFYFVKFASLIESPACAQVNLAESDPYYSIAFSNVIKFPADLDILSPSTKMYPLQ